jgi:Acetyltransferase (GNAT) domain
VAYSYRIFDSIEHVDLTEWQRVRASCNASIFTDPRFIAAVEVSMKHLEKFWYIIIYDEGGAPVACTSVSTMTVDLVDLADPSLAGVIRHTPLLSSWLRHWKLLIGGLPVGTGHNTLAIAQRSTSAQLLPILDRVICDLATDAQADAIAYKEFGQGDLAWTAPLLDLGYHRIPTPPMHFFRPAFEDFSQYCAALKSHYRQQINRSRRKLKEGGLEIVVLSDPEEILRAYTSEVHALYHQMADRATIKLEVLPIEFLHQLTSRLRGHVELLAIRKDTRIVAFGWNIHTPSSYHAMYGGLDYRLNHEFDLYFNLIYAMLGCALAKQASRIEVGLGGDAFKAKLGCYSEPLYVFAKGRGPLMSRIVRAAGHLLIARKPATPSFNILRSSAHASENKVRRRQQPAQLRFPVLTRRRGRLLALRSERDESFGALKAESLPLRAELQLQRNAT